MIDEGFIPLFVNIVQSDLCNSTRRDLWSSFWMGCKVSAQLAFCSRDWNFVYWPLYPGVEFDLQETNSFERLKLIFLSVNLNDKSTKCYKTIADGGITEDIWISKSILPIEIPFGSSRTWGIIELLWIIKVHTFIWNDL